MRQPSSRLLHGHTDTMDWEWYRPWRSAVATVNQTLLERHAEMCSYLQPPSSKAVQMLQIEPRELTLLIQFGNRSSLAKRGQVLLRLQYPELAAGDLYKALQPAVVLNESKTVLLLAQALFMANSFLECEAVIGTYTATSSSNAELGKLKRYAQDSFAMEQEEDMRTQEFKSIVTGDFAEQLMDKDDAGEVVSVVYPWIKPAWTTRKSSVIATANTQLFERPLGQCAIQQSEINSQTSDCFGLYALKSVASGSWLLTDSTQLCATDAGRSRCDSCAGELSLPHFELMCCRTDARFCSKTCMDNAQSMYHKPSCGEVFDQSDMRNRDHQAMAGNWLRVLASIMQALDDERNTFRHPLEVPLVNRLLMTHNTTVRFSLQHDVVEPIRILIKMGIDVYTDMRFDTWVLRTIAGRLETNLREDTMTTRFNNEIELLAVNPIYAFANHSCEPNVKSLANVSKHNSSLQLRAKQRIGRGEELFISYLDDDQLKLNLEERNKLLESWTGGTCNCSKCTRERAMMDGEDDRDYYPDKSSSDGGSGGEGPGDESDEDSSEEDFSD